MTKKIKILSKFPENSIPGMAKPGTVTRAGITADIKLTRGKELVEHNPALLIPDPHNPRPGDVIDDAWLQQMLFCGSENNRCHTCPVTGDYLIPTAHELGQALSEGVKEHYTFLRGLAFSIRNDGLIEPIEIFLADRNNDPEYFTHLSLDYGYVVLEGHQRRLAAIMAGVPTVTCIQITDETMLAKLKVKHRKLRRQLSENNLRKDITVAQNFKIVRELLSTAEGENLSVKELSSIIGLNEDISGALKRLSLNASRYPAEMIRLIEENQVSFKWIRAQLAKSPDQILFELSQLKSAATAPVPKKPRGLKGGAVKRSAIFKVQTETDSNLLQHWLRSRIPELETHAHENSFVTLEKLLQQLMNLAKTAHPTRVG